MSAPAGPTERSTTFAERIDDVPDRVALTEITGSRDPEAVYAQLRARWGQVAPVDIEPGVPAWLALGYTEVTSVLRNQAQFSREAARWRHAAGGTHLQGHRGAAGADGARQRHLRAALDDAFDGLDDERVARATSIASMTALAPVLARGEADMVREYAAAVSLLTLADLVGLGAADATRLVELDGILRSGSPEAASAAAEREALLGAVVAARRSDPRDDLATVLATHPNHASAAEAAESIGVAFGMGYDAQTALIATTLHQMATDRPFHERIRSGRLEIDEAIEEVARFRPPVAHLAPRYALADCELGGRRIAAGDAVVPGVAAANTDPALRSDDPWEDLGARFHLSWGVGVHASPGRRMGAVVSRYAVGIILVRIDRLLLTVAPDAVEMVATPWQRYPRSLPVRFAVRPA
ncbi:MAG: cytochrome P450 [Promicromonosporaceae bacterium]|nr:cytochrome P450 [Promicromonosporaceae bacterium]